MKCVESDNVFGLWYLHLRLFYAYTHTFWGFLIIFFKAPLIISYLFQTLCVSHQDVLTHQFLDHRVGASVQLSEEAQAEPLHTRRS